MPRRLQVPKFLSVLIAHQQSPEISRQRNIGFRQVVALLPIPASGFHVRIGHVRLRR